MKRLASTTTLLAAGAQYSSDWQGSPDSIFLTLSSFSDQNSAPGGIAIEQTDDPSNSAGATSLALSSMIGTAWGGQQFVSQAVITRRYWRVRYVNGATAQTAFQLLISGAPDASFAILFELQRQTQLLRSIIDVLLVPPLKSAPEDEYSNPFAQMSQLG